MALEREKHIAERALLTIDEAQLMDLYRRMVLIRRFEDKVAEMYSRGKITGFCHLYAGEEAVAVGAISALYDKDYVVSTYREHGHCLAKGAEVVCCFFGDGALPQGAFHESLNMASLWKLPVIFICENNFYGMGTLVQNAICQEELYRFAEPYKMPGVRVDGMDVLAVYQAVIEAAARAREGHGPSLIEAVTYRYRGHSMSDPAEYRSKREERIWQERDPIKKLRARLQHEGNSIDTKLDEVDREVTAIIDDAVKFSEESPEPSLDELGKYVYVE